MYHNPFGSIFGAQFEPKNNQIEQIAAAAAAPKKDAPSSESKEPKAKTKPFQSTVPQFQATVKETAKDPKLELALAKYTFEQKKLEKKLAEQDATSLQARLAASELYYQLLLDYINSPEGKKAEVTQWVKDNQKSLNNIIQAKKLQQEATKTFVKNADLDLQIKNLQNIVNLKKQGVAVSGTPELKYYRPTQNKVSAAPKDNPIIPKIHGQVPMKQLYTINQLGEGENKSKDTIASYFYQFKNSLMSPKDYGTNQQKTWDTSQITKKAEQNVVLAKELVWQTNQLDKQKKDLFKKYEEARDKVTALVTHLNRLNKDSNLVTTALGVLTEVNPAVFKTGLSIRNLQISLKGASQLGDTDNTPVIDPSQLLVTQATVNNAVAQQEQAEKQDTLSKLTAQITGIPATPVTLPVQPQVTPSLLQTIKKLLPLAIALFIFIKLLG